MQPSAARVPEAKYEAIQNFVTNSPWDWVDTQSRLTDLMREKVSGSHGLLVVDDVPLVKKGEKSPGVSRQYCGVKGDVDNCQALVDCAYVLPRGTVHRETVAWCFALELYLPRSWSEDLERCKEAGVPTPVVFREKWRIALEEVDRARQHRLPHQATIADCGYGDAREFRTELRSRGEPYVMEVTTSELRVIRATAPILRPENILGNGMGRQRTRARLLPDISPTTPAALAAEAKDWVTIRWAEGTKGPLEGEFSRRKVRVCRGAKGPTDEVGWLLLERTSDGPRSWICWGLNSLGLEELALMAHRRFFIERFHEEAKMELGMDHFEGRRWRGLNHHLTLVLIAHTFLVLEQLATQEVGTAETGEKARLPTLAEMRRQVVIEAALAMVSRVALDRTKKERMTWATAVAHYWAGAG